MKDRHLTSAPDQKIEVSNERAFEVPDQELEDVVGGVDILDRIKPPSNDRPPIEAPILNPFS